MEAEGKTSLESIINACPISRYQVSIIVLCSMVAMVDGFDTQSIAFVAPELANAWHIDASVFGPVFGAGLFGGMIGAMSLGIVGDRIGRKPTMITAIAIFAFGSLCASFAQTVFQLGVLRFVTGLGLGGALPIVISLASEFAPRNLRAMLVALMFSGFPAGAVLGGLASAKLIPWFGWKSVFVVGGALPLVLLPLLVAFVPESVRFLVLRDDAQSVRRVLKRIRPDLTWDGRIDLKASEVNAPLSMLFTEGRLLGTLLLWATFFLSLLLSYFLLNWIPIIARQAGHDAETGVLAVVMLNLGAIVGCALIGRAADRFGQALMIGLGYSFGAAATVLIGYSGQSGLLLLGASFVAGFLSIGSQMCTVALCATIYETRIRATGVGWTVGVGRVGAVVGPILGGALIGAGVSASAFFVAAALASLGAAIGVFALGWFVLTTATPAAEGSFPDPGLRLVDEV